MKQLLPLFIWFSLPCFMIAQNKNIDSLLVVLKTQKDLVQNIATLNEICTEYQKNNVEKVIFYNRKILNLSKKNKYELGYGFYFLQRSYINLHKKNYKLSTADALKAKYIFKKNNAISNYLSSIIYETNSYIQRGENEKIKVLLLQSLPLAVKNKKSEIIINFYRLIGDNYRFQDSIIQSLFYYKQAIPYLSSKKTKAKSNLLEKLSDEYALLKQYKNALIYIDESIQCEETKYRFFGESKKALYYNCIQDYNKALQISLKNHDTIVKNNMISDWHYNLIVYNIAYSYSHLGKYNLAIPYINKVIDPKNNIPEYKIEALTLLSNIYLHGNKKKEASKYIRKALFIRDSLYPLGMNDNLFSTLAKTDEALGNYKRALYYYKKQTNFDIYNLTKRNNEMVFQQQTEFDVALKDANIIQLKIVQLQKSIENKNQKENIVYLSIALILSLLSAFFYFRNNKIINKKNFIIENEKLLTQKSLAEKETLLREIHHRVKNNMQMVISLLKIQSLNAKKLTVEDFISVSEARINSMVLVHENLYQSQNLSKVDFKEYMNNLITSILSSYQGFKKIELQIDVHDIYFDVQTAIPIGLIVSELINNAYKHAFVNRSSGTIKISLSANKKKFTLSISDNGIGFENKQEQQNGLGLELVRLLVSQIKGTLQIENSLGTIFKIHFKTIKL